MSKTLEENINQAISDFGGIKAAIETQGVEVGYAPTSEYDDKVLSIESTHGQPYLPIYQTTEEEFWESYNNGEIVNGLYQYISYTLGYEDIGETYGFFEGKESHDNSLSCLETETKIYIGNGKSNHENNSGLIVVDKEKDSSKLVQIFDEEMQAYTYVGGFRNVAGIGMDASGNIYTTTNGTTALSYSIIATIDGDTDEVVNVYNTITYNNFVFYQVSYNTDTLNPAYQQRESLLVNDGGTFAYGAGTYPCLCYCKDGNIKKIESIVGLYQTQFLCADKQNSLFYGVYNYGKKIDCYDIDLNKNTFDYSSYFNSSSDLHLHKIICRNGKLYLWFKETDHSNNNSYYHIAKYENQTFTIIKTFDLEESIYDEKTSANYYDNGKSIFWLASYSRKISIISFDYIADTVSLTKISDDARFDYGQVLYLYESNGNILITTNDLDKNGNTYVINTDDLTNYSYSFKATGISSYYLPTIQTENGIVAVAYASGVATALEIDHNGNIDINNILFSDNNFSSSSVLNQIGNNIVISELKHEQSTKYYYQMNDRQFIETDNFQEKQIPVLPYKNDNIYYTGGTLCKLSQNNKNRSKLVSMGEIIL